MAPREREAAAAPLEYPPVVVSMLTVLRRLVCVRRRLHAAVVKDLEQLIAERVDVLLDLVDVVLRNALRLTAVLPLHDVALDEVAHDRLQHMVMHH